MCVQGGVALDGDCREGGTFRLKLAFSEISYCTFKRTKWLEKLFHRNRELWRFEKKRRVKKNALIYRFNQKKKATSIRVWIPRQQNTNLFFRSLFLLPVVVLIKLFKVAILTVPFFFRFLVCSFPWVSLLFPSHRFLFFLLLLLWIFIILIFSVSI